MQTIQLLLAARSGDGADLAVALGSEAARWQATWPALRVRHGARVPEDPFATTEQGSNAGAFTIDGVLEAAVPGAGDWSRLFDLARSAGEHLSGVVDPARSAAIAGIEHDIVPGEMPILLVYALRRLPSLTHEGFSDYWLNHHADFGRRIQAGRGYRQLHGDLEASSELAAAAGVAIDDLDGIAEAAYPDLQVFLEVMSQPAVAAEAMEDEKTFIDHSRSAGSVVADPNRRWLTSVTWGRRPPRSPARPVRRRVRARPRTRPDARPRPRPPR